MHPDLSPHLHSEECNKLISALHECHKEHTFGKFIGKCNEIDVLMLKCMKKERQARRDANAERSKIERAAVLERMKADKTDYSQFFKQ